jgi:hypothetical protein
MEEVKQEKREEKKESNVTRPYFDLELVGLKLHSDFYSDTNAEFLYKNEVFLLFSTDF